MNKMKSLLLEALHSLYHGTYVDKLIKILNDNAIKMTYSTDVERTIGSGKKHFYLSTGRPKFGMYALRNGTDVVIELNGPALENSRDIEIKSVDFWGSMKPKDPIGYAHRDESEERIYSEFKNKITPLDKYIRAVYVYYNFDDRSFVEKNGKIDDIAIYRLKHVYMKVAMMALHGRGFPVHFYSNYKNPKSYEYFKLQRPETSMTPQEFLKMGASIIKKYELNKHAPYEPYKSTSRIYNLDINELNILIDIADHPENYVNSDFHKLGKEVNRVIGYFMYYTWDAIPHFEALVHNLRRDHPEEFVMLAKSMKRNGVHTLRDYIKKILDQRWYTEYIPTKNIYVLLKEK